MDSLATLHHSLPLRSRPDGARHWRAADLSLPVSATRHPVLLASVSPRRRELLRRAGVCFRVFDPGEDPPFHHLESWPAACLRAAHKAAQGARACPGRLSLGADTVVVYGGHTLGKPEEAEEARWMLGLLSGRTHEVYTAFCLAVQGRGSTGFPAWATGVSDTGREAGAARILWLEVVRTQVRFRPLSEDDITAYIASGAPFDKAGGYGIQDRAHGLVESIRGSYYNVVGLPVGQVCAALGQVGQAACAGRAIRVGWAI